MDTEYFQDGESTSRQHIVMVFFADGTILQPRRPRVSRHRHRISRACGKGSFLQTGSLTTSDADSDDTIGGPTIFTDLRVWISSPS